MIGGACNLPKILASGDVYSRFNFARSITGLSVSVVFTTSDLLSDVSSSS